jgi:HK97 family phage portal protein
VKSLNILTKLFKSKNAEKQNNTSAGVLEIRSGLSAFSGAAYENAIFRGAVDTIAKHTAKLKPRTIPAISQLDRILQTEPNPHISAYDFLYKAATAYFCDNNAFILIHRDNSENVTGLYNITPSSVEFLHTNNNILYCKFIFKDDESVIIPYDDIIHLRRHFSKNELLGSNNSPLFPALETVHAQTEGIKAAIKNGVTIRGIMKVNQVLKEVKLKEVKDEFVNNYMQMNNNGGVIAIDAKMDYTPINANTVDVNTEQIKAIQNQIYSYLNISEKIVNSSYSEDEFAAFYESVIEPLALQMSLEFTRKIFTARERAFKREIIFSGERLEFTSAKTRIELLRHLLPYGLITINEGRKLLSLPEVADGDKRLQSLNYVNAAKADEYQDINNNESGEKENAE